MGLSLKVGIMPSHMIGRTRKAGRMGSVLLLLWLAGLAAAVSLGFLAPLAAQETVTPQDMVRWDWYFRESLAGDRRLGRDPGRARGRFGTRTTRARVSHSQRRSGCDLAESNSAQSAAAGGSRVRACAWPWRTSVCASRDSAARTRLREMRRCRLPNSGKSVPGYKHPGGGGRDQWYHGYERRFDRLTEFVPQPAPFAVEFEPLPDLGLGPQQLVIRLRNATEVPCSLAWGWTFYSRETAGARKEEPESPDSLSPKSPSKNRWGDLRSAVPAGSETRAERGLWIGSEAGRGRDAIRRGASD